MTFDVPDGRPSSIEDWQARIYEALELFSPGAPIDESSLLAGRSKQIKKMIETVMQRGQHAILYGERGVGKSSLANTFAKRISTGARKLLSIPVNCHPNDDFSQVWRKVFRRIDIDDYNLADKYNDSIYPDDVVIEFGGFSLNIMTIVILDEFDKLKNLDARNLIANTIKNLSDRSIRTTVIIVGVADSVGGLIGEHESISRCLRQIHMQRMFPSELKEIINRRLPEIGMIIDPESLNHIISLSRGLPHYTHLFGQRSAKRALERGSLSIQLHDIESAIPECIEQIDQSVRKQYHQATLSLRSGNIYKEVLLAAALAQVDELGYFAPSDLRKTLSTLLKQEAPVSLFGQHLKNLCQADRGSIFEQTGSARKYRYRFVEPMMQPFILLHGRRSGLISREQVDELAASHYEPITSNET